MTIFKKGQRPRGDSKRWRDEVYDSPHTMRYCPICGIRTAWEVRQSDSICLKCKTEYNKAGNKLVKRGDLPEVSND